MHCKGTKGEKRRLLDCVNSITDHLLEGPIRAVVVGWRFGNKVYERVGYHIVSYVINMIMVSLK